MVRHTPALMTAIGLNDYMLAVRIDHDLRALPFPADDQLMSIVRFRFLQRIGDPGILFWFLRILSVRILL